MKAREVFYTNGELSGWSFKCPGCNKTHEINTTWGFNGNLNQPTITPSILVTTGHVPAKICHSFVTDGNIQFLGDCTHELAGQTVPLPEL